MNYYFICKTKLWLFSHNIQMERENERVRIGKLIHESSYKRENKNVIIDSAIALDFIRKGKTIEVHDVKKSKRMEDAHKWQLLYYLYYLHKKGIEAVGVLDYPLLREKEIIEGDETKFKRIEEIIEDMNRIVLGPMPEAEPRKICKKCSYYEFCFAEE